MSCVLAGTITETEIPGPELRCWYLGFSAAWLLLWIGEALALSLSIDTNVPAIAGHSSAIGRLLVHSSALLRLAICLATTATMVLLASMRLRQDLSDLLEQSWDYGLAWWWIAVHPTAYAALFGSTKRLRGHGPIVAAGPYCHPVDKLRRGDGRFLGLGRQAARLLAPLAAARGRHCGSGPRWRFLPRRSVVRLADFTSRRDGWRSTLWPWGWSPSRGKWGCSHGSIGLLGVQPVAIANSTAAHLGPLLAITGAGHHSRNNDHRGNVRRPVQRWPAGTIAGMLYALVLRREGQLSHVVPTHAATNAMISVHVLIPGSWSLWM